MKTIHCWISATSAVASVASTVCAVSPPLISGLGYFPGQSRASANGISRDGTTIVGVANYVPPGQTQVHETAFRWRASTGLRALGVAAGPTWPGSTSSVAQAVSADGEVVVGWSDGVAIRWVSGTGPGTGLAVLPAAPSGQIPSQAYAVSGSGTWVTGWFNFETQGPAFSWSGATGTKTIPQVGLGGTGDACTGRVILDDGTVIGSGRTGTDRKAFKRGLDNAFVFLAPPAGRLFWEPRAATPDGGVIAGRTCDPNLKFTFNRYTPSSNEDLGTVGVDNFVEPLAMSADGNTIVGWSQYIGPTSSTPQRAVYWTPATGVVDLKSYLQSRGADVSGWTFYQATGISGDGRTVVGNGLHGNLYEAFIVHFPYSPADLGTQGGMGGADGSLDNNDFVVFINYFFAGDLRGDLGVQGGLPGQDGRLDNNDFVVFINSFFAGFTY